MMLALILAQIVLPWPGLDSPLVQPGPTICVGECAGPVIYGPAEQPGRLVVACDMRSDTCSDGRQITTTRSTPVPCEVAPGQWEMVPEDTGCYSVRGLESWEQNTSYLSWGAELDRSPWTPARGGTVEKLPDGWRVKNDPNQNHSGMTQVLTGAASGEVWTSAYILRTSTDVIFQLWAGASQACGSNFVLNTGGAWMQFSCSTAVPSSPMAAIYPGSSAGSTPRPQYSVDVKAAWTVKSDTRGRPCWGGEAPVTCARDFHRLPATGFPVTTGEIAWVMRLERVPDGTSALRGIIWADGAPTPNRLSLTEGGAIRINTGSMVYVTGPLSWEPGRSYAVRLIMAEDEWKVVRDGALVGSTPPLGSMDWRTVVRVGDLLDGSISSLTVRSYE